jgi:hypothetical protein
MFMFHFNPANAQAGKSIAYRDEKQPTIILGNSQKTQSAAKNDFCFSGTQCS